MGVWHIRRIISAVLAVCLVLSLVILQNAFADEEPVIVISETETFKGGKAEVTVSLKNNPGVAAVMLDVCFDSDLLLEEIVYNSEQFGGYTYTPDDYESPVTLSWMSLSNVSGDVLFATIKFSALSGAAAGDHIISAEYLEGNIYNVDESNISFSVTNGKITVSECNHINTTVYPAALSTCSAQGHAEYTKCNDCGAILAGSDELLPIDPENHTESDWIIDKSPSIYESGSKHKECTACGKVLENEVIPDTHVPGDVDADGELTNQDLILMFQYLSGWDVSPNIAAIDVDNDGEHTNQDLILLFQKLSGWNVEIF